MKKEEAIKMLSNTKVYVDGKSKEIQNKLFEIGFKWGSVGAEIHHMESPFILIHPDLSLGHGCDMDLFKDFKYTEIKVDDILSITIDKECEFKPFDKVLARSADNCVWQGNIISHIVKDENGWRIYTN